MPTEAELLFEKLQTLSGLERLIGRTEGAVLECKTWPSSDDEAQKRILAKAISGFANATGGVLVFGLEARSQGRDEPDLVSALKPVEDRHRVKSRIWELAGQLVEPLIQNLRVVDVESGVDSTSGLVVVLIPATDGPPPITKRLAILSSNWIGHFPDGVFSD
jgi:predicted HTH transcriptional regulator